MNTTDLQSTQFEPGAPVSEGMIPLCVPEIRGNEWKYIKECLDTNWVSSVGAFVDRFERELAEYVGAKYAVATCNGTAALHIALLVTGVQPDDEVLVSTITFISSANAIRYASAWPVFIDAEPDYWQMDPQKVVDFLEQECRWANGELRNKTTNRCVKAIMPVHILGHPVEMDPILEVARKYNLVVIEDATESLGAKYKGHKVGHLGDVPGITPMQEAEWAFSIFWMYTILVDEAKYGMSSRALLCKLGDEKIQTRPLWQPIHNSPAHTGSQGCRCDVAERLNQEALSLPCSVGLETGQLTKVMQMIRGFHKDTET